MVDSVKGIYIDIAWSHSEQSEVAVNPSKPKPKPRYHSQV